MNESMETLMPTDENLRTKGDKARAAAHVGQILKTHGVPKEQAGNYAAHELKHALSDTGPGHMGIVIENDHVVSGAYYEPKGKRSHGEQLKIQTAPGLRNMSRTDKHNAIQSIFGLLKNLLR